MGYLPLCSTSDGSTAVVGAESRKSPMRKPSQSLSPSTRRKFFDEHPLLELSILSRASLKKNSVEADVVEIDGFSYDAASQNEEMEHYVDLENPGKNSLLNVLKVRLNSIYGLVRSSGPFMLLGSVDNTAEQRRPWMPTGWRLGTWVCCSAVILCILVEFALLVYAQKRSSARESGLLVQGNCEEIREFELWLLLPLNIVGTILIGTSNYVMQVVSAPDRKEIDKAHARARPIAVAGMRFNELSFGTENKYRRSIWWVLGISSLPIHFLLNAAVYSSVQASNTGVLIVSEDFDTDTTWEYCDHLAENATSAETLTCSLYQSYTNNQTVPFTTSQCLRQYSDGFQTNASSVVVVTGRQSKRWYTTPSKSEIPDTVSYGMHCMERYELCNDTSSFEIVLDSTNDSVPASECLVGYTETSNNLYHFAYEPAEESTTISLGFVPFCENQTNRTDDGRYLNFAILPSDRSSGNFSHPIYGVLSLRESDGLSNITSIRALFNAFQYRYWAAASISGEYMRSDYLDLLENRDPRSWICPRENSESNEQCDPAMLQRAGEWYITPEQMKVQQCHVLPKQELCALRYSLGILVITICFDVIKLGAMIAAVTLISNPLTTLGDLIESFLRTPDIHTQNRRILDDETIFSWIELVERKISKEAWTYTTMRFGVDFWTRSVCSDCGEKMHSDPTILSVHRSIATTHRQCGRLPTDSPELSKFGEKAFEWLCEGGTWWSTLGTEADDREATILEPRRWFQVPSRTRWLWSAILYLPAMLLAILYFSISFRSLLTQRLLKPWTVGFTAPDPNSLLTGGLSGTASIYVAAILINAPQVAFSMLYFIFNATLTMMHTAHEWASFVVHRKALRVSVPRGQQRATYWLQLPWTYSIPLIAISGSMHWLLSRSLYIVKVDVYGYLGEREAEQDYFACGYSPIPALLLIVVLASMGIILGGLAFRWLPVGMPLVRLNSMAIAAACHANPEEKNLELEPLMWGLLEDFYRKDGKPHYSFSARQVIPQQTSTAAKRKNNRKSLKGWPFGQSRAGSSMKSLTSSV